MSHSGQTAYVSKWTIPDITCAVKQISQTKAAEETKTYFNCLDIVFGRLESEDFELKYEKEELDTAEVQVFVYSSFATN